MRLGRTPRTALLVALAALAGALGTAALTALAAPGDGGVINACTNNLRGTLRVVDAGVACAADETALNWNQRGLAGPAGPPGERGAAGVDGATRQLGGPDTVDPSIARTVARPVAKPKKIKLKIAPTGEPTNAFLARRENGFNFPLAKGFDPYPTVARLEVPAGSYLVQAKGFAIGEPPLLAIGGGCALVSGVAGASDSMSLEPGDVMMLTLVGSLKKPGAIELRCGRRSDPGLGLYDVTISAINVAKISSQKTAPPF